jgi:hypothetical protein
MFYHRNSVSGQFRSEPFPLVCHYTVFARLPPEFSLKAVQVRAISVGPSLYSICSFFIGSLWPFYCYILPPEFSLSPDQLRVISVGFSFGVLSYIPAFLIALHLPTLTRHDLSSPTVHNSQVTEQAIQYIYSSLFMGRNHKRHCTMELRLAQTKFSPDIVDILACPKERRHMVKLAEIFGGPAIAIKLYK